MDANQFDSISRAFAHSGTRRGMTRLLVGLPALAGLLAQRDPDPATALDDDHGSSHRRRRRGTRHKHDRNIVRRNKKHKPHKSKGQGKGTGTDTGPGPDTGPVRYCHAITANGGPCPNASEYCLSEPIVATSSTHARIACEACFGAGGCLASSPFSGALTWADGTGTHFAYTNADNDFCGVFSFAVAGDILSPPGCPIDHRWAP